jgi:hypothetical protein
MGWGHLKFFKNYWVRRAHIYMKAFWYNVDSSLFTSWFSGVMRVHNRENHIYMCLYWLIVVLRPLKNFSLIWRRHHYRWRTAKFSPMLGAQGRWAERDLYRTTPAVTKGLGFSGLIRRTALFSRLVRHTRGCGESILTRILTGLKIFSRTSMPISIKPGTNHPWVKEILSCVNKWLCLFVCL